ncbi:hypothetical protein [Mycobacterium sp. P7213]|uniref:hypothetical protein n=1 Tax=Mycobacterium sp. P7213 TaxID=2478465 RepID=UPI000F6379E0|nr:hypothetical protein [Mycobacterium sp. P7213]
METVKSAVRLPSIAIAATALVAAGLTPVAAAPEISTRTVAAMSAEVTLAANTVVDSFEALAGLAPVDMSSLAEELNVPGDLDLSEVLPGAAYALDVPGAADAFDIVGLFNAEVAAAVGLFNRFISLPFTLYNDFTNLFTSLINLDFGMAFSQAATIPLDIFNYVVGLPGAVLNTAFNMLFVLPGEYLFNFG